MADEGGQTSVPNSLAQYSMMASVGLSVVCGRVGRAQSVPSSRI